MLFNSSTFLIFFPVVTLIYFIIPHKVRYLWLLLASYYFYMCWNPIYLILIVISTLITYASGLLMNYINNSKIEDKKKVSYKKATLIFSLVANLGILAYFKYFNFFISNLNTLFNTFHINIIFNSVDVLLPVGISFYTFQALSYSMDVYRGDVECEKNPFRYALFVSFFPQLVAGPIERSKDLLHQINEKHEFSYERLRSGLLLMLWGYFLKMVIADRIAIFVDTVYGNYAEYAGWYLIVASILFAFQIYCDFAGYSTIALGAAEIMGFKLTDNFNAPYFAQSVAEFWRRWHITLSSWFRDYVYIPLGGNRNGTLRKYINLLIVFLLSGLWHGAEWTFVIWGCINGIYQIIGSLLKPLRNKVTNLLNLDRTSLSHKLFRTAFTFILIDLTWVFFRAANLSEAVDVFRSMLTATNIHVLFDDSLFIAGLDAKNYIVMIISLVILMVADYFKYKGIVIRDIILKQELWFRYLVIVTSVLVILIFGIYGSSYDVASFIYFQF